MAILPAPALAASDRGAVDLRSKRNAGVWWWGAPGVRHLQTSHSQSTRNGEKPATGSVLDDSQLIVVNVTILTTRKETHVKKANRRIGAGVNQERNHNRLETNLILRGSAVLRGPGLKSLTGHPVNIAVVIAIVIATALFVAPPLIVAPMRRQAPGLAVVQNLGSRRLPILLSRTRKRKKANGKEIVSGNTKIKNGTETLRQYRGWDPNEPRLTFEYYRARLCVPPRRSGSNFVSEQDRRQQFPYSFDTSRSPEVSSAAIAAVRWI